MVLLENLKGLLLKGNPTVSKETTEKAMSIEINSIFSDVKGTIVVSDTHLPKAYQPYASNKITNIYERTDLIFYVLQSKTLQKKEVYSIVTDYTFMPNAKKEYLLSLGITENNFQELMLAATLEQENTAITSANEIQEEDSKTKEKADSKTKNFDYIEYTKGMYLGVGTSTICELLDDHLTGHSKDWSFYFNDVVSRSFLHTFHIAITFIPFKMFKARDPDVVLMQIITTNIINFIDMLYNNEGVLIKLPHLLTVSVMMLSPDFVINNPTISGYASTVFEKASCAKLVQHIGENVLSHSSGMLEDIVHLSSNSTEYIGNLICDNFNIC